ncbi:Cyclin-like superfamily [Arabidopsis thaliana x Arabidopsis arenosa]|nr:Cyclin-like superfamily [Arabidopsis thaliana x Arabidopsis arenosa]
MVLYFVSRINLANSCSLKCRSDLDKSINRQTSKTASDQDQQHSLLVNAFNEKIQKLERDFERTFASDDNHGDRDPNRVGAATNPFLKSGDLVTIIEKPKETASSVLSKDDISTLFRAHNQVKNHEEDLIKQAFEEIQRMTDALDLDIVINSRACEIVSKYDGHANTKLRRGKKLNAVCAASVSTACRELQLSRTLKEIAEVANGVDKKDIRKESLVIKRVLESHQTSVSASQAIINTGELVRRFCSKLDISQREIMAIREATNRKPIREIGIVAEVVENTIKNSVKDMYPYALKIIPNWYACESDIIKRLDGVITSWDSAKISV